MRRFFLILVGLLFLAGCGGGGGGTTTTPPPVKSANVSLQVDWGERTRIVNAPSSALSGTLVIKGANPAGGDYSLPLDRPSGLNTAYTKTYTTPSPVLTGTWTAIVTFYANTGAQGVVVGSAMRQVTIATANQNLGEFVTVGTVAAVLVPTPQTFTIGQPGDLVFTAVDAKGNALAITPGSAVWTITAADSNAVEAPVQIDNSGHVTPSLPASYHISVNVDTKVNGQDVISGQAVANIMAPTNVYNLASLGMLPGDVSSEPYGLNATGDVVGYSGKRYDGTLDPQHAVLWRNGSSIQSLGALPGDTYSVALGINAGDQVVGVSSSLYIYFWGFEISPSLRIRSAFTYDEVTPNSAMHAFLWTQGGGIQTLPLTVANSINDSGQVAGMVNDHAALWTSGGGVTDLGSLPGLPISTAIAINNAGQVLCQASSNHDQSAVIRSFLWTQAGGIQDLGSAGSGPSVARALSSNGIVAGAEYLPGYKNTIYTWTASGGYTLLPLGPYPVRAIASYPAGINASDVIVTQDAYYIVNSLWLNLSYLFPATVPHIDQLHGINDKGQIIAVRLDTDEAVLLTPR